MSIVADLRKLTPDTFLDALLVVIAFFAPGVLVIYLFDYDLFRTADTFKLILLAFSLGAPLIFLNFALALVCHHAFEQDNKPQVDELFGFIIAIISVSIYPALLVAYIWNLTFGIFLAWVAAFNGLIVLLVIIGTMIENKERKTAPSDEPN